MAAWCFSTGGGIGGGVLVVVVLVVAAILLGAEVTQAGKREKGGGKNKVCRVKASQLSDSPFKARCKNGTLISHISLTGHSGPHCQGLTPDLFVQMNACFWKKRCLISYSPEGPQYMLKLYKGDMATCLTKTPTIFTITYECTHNAIRPHIVREKKKGQKEGEKEVDAQEGILLSHADHPWLYRRHPEDEVRQSITLLSPNSSKTLVYTIRSLRLMAGDNLTVNWTSDDVSWTVRGFHSDHWLSHVTQDGGSPPVLSNNTFHVPGTPRRVVFSLDTARHTNGGEGFVICFRWLDKVELEDSCKLLMKPKKCPRKKKGRGKEGAEKEKRKGKKRKGKNKKGKRRKKNKKEREEENGEGRKGEPKGMN